MLEEIIKLIIKKGKEKDIERIRSELGWSKKELMKFVCG
jgi:hypothetical protein